MDPHYVHPSWGVTPGLDLLDVRAHVLGASGEGEAPAASLLQIAPVDCRHTAASLAGFCRGPRGSGDPAGPPPLQVAVWESEVECIARHALLLTALVDDGLTERERREVFIEMFANVRVRLRTLRSRALCGDPGAAQETR